MWARLRPLLAASVILATGCSSADEARWCEIATDVLDRGGSQTAELLDEWADVSPGGISDATSDYVDITKIMRERIANADPEDVDQATAKAFSDMRSNPVFNQAAQDISIHANETCG